jgi:hypothetical protein
LIAAYKKWVFPFLESFIPRGAETLWPQVCHNPWLIDRITGLQNNLNYEKSNIEAGDRQQWGGLGSRPT